ncbi:MAG TPA: competence protein CoiA family protein [Leptolyngbyaceae cyanobacterium]
MPFKALDVNKNPVCTFGFRDRLELKNKYPEGFTCPYCSQTMFPRKRYGGVLHFYHSSRCTSIMEHHPETKEHLLGKQLLYNEICQQIQTLNNNKLKVEIEYPIPQAGKHGRIADLMITYAGQPYIAIECQLASISVESLEKRTQDYLDQEIDVIWFIGKEADNRYNRDFLYKEFGECHVIEFQEDFVSNNENIFGGIFKHDKNTVK